MNGVEAAAEIQKKAPHCASIYMSGYLDDDIRTWGPELQEGHFLHKPFTLARLLSLVSEALTEKAA